MNIAYVVPSLAAKGPVLVARDLATEFTRRGHTCTVYYFDEVVELEFDRAVRIAKDEPIDFSAYDVVHSHGLRPDTYVAKHREYSGRVRYVSTLHNYMFEDLAYQYNWLVAQVFGRKWLRVLKKMDRVVALSKDAMRYYGRWFAADRLTYAYNTRALTDGSVDAAELLRFKGDSVLIGVNALLTKRKGVDLLIDALPELPQYKLFVVGDGPERKKLERQAARLGVADRCCFAGYRKDAHLYLPHYDLYALPSRSEGFPLALLEAAQYGKKCVTSDLPVVCETFDGAVERFSLSDPKSVAPAIRRATANDALPQAIKNRFDERYAPEALYRSYFAVYSAKIAKFVRE